MTFAAGFMAGVLTTMLTLLIGLVWAGRELRIEDAQRATRQARRTR